MLNKRLAHHFLSYPGDDCFEVFYSLPVLGRAAVGIVDGVVPAVLVQATQVFLAGRRGHVRSNSLIRKLATRFLVVFENNNCLKSILHRSRL